MHPRNKLFRQLRDLWVSAEPGRRTVDLTDRLGIRAQAVSVMTTGSDGRTPPWWAILEIAHDLGLEVRVNHGGMVLTRSRGKDGSLATRKDDIVIEFSDDERRAL